MTADLLPGGLRWAVVGSAMVHALVLTVAIVAGGGAAGRRVVTRQTVLTTRLVRLGERRPESWLPRKPPPAQAAATTAMPEPAAPAKPATPPSTQQPTPSARDRLDELGKVRGALDRVKQRTERELQGDPGGVEEGEVTDLTRAITGNKFATEIYRCVKAHYSVEGMEASQLVGRKATVLVRVSSDGAFLDWRIEQGSGVLRLDQAVERAVKQCGKVSPPDAAIRDQVREDGVEIVFET